MIEIKAPNGFFNSPRPWVFLSGSIEMGKAELWQDRAIRGLESVPGTVLNPRRDYWDSSWTQWITNPQFSEQVSWELEGLERANVVPVYFDPDTESPITLMELGLIAPNAQKSRHVVVCCPEGYWRKGNVDIVCARFGIQTVDTFESLMHWTVEWVNRTYSMPPPGSFA